MFTEKPAVVTHQHDDRVIPQAETVHRMEHASERAVEIGDAGVVLANVIGQSHFSVAAELEAAFAMPSGFQIRRFPAERVTPVARHGNEHMFVGRRRLRPGHPAVIIIHVRQLRAQIQEEGPIRGGGRFDEVHGLV